MITARYDLKFYIYFMLSGFKELVTKPMGQNPS